MMGQCSLQRHHLQHKRTSTGDIVKETYTQDPKRLNKPVEFFKILAQDPSRDPEEVASDIGMQKPTAWRRIYDFCICPSGLLVFYNRFLVSAYIKVS